MRARLYPQTRPESLEEAQDLLANRDLLFIVALDDDGEVLGFAEARCDTTTSTGAKRRRSFFSRESTLNRTRAVAA